MSISLILLIALIVLLLATLPAWPYSRGWGYGPSAILAIALVIVVVLMMTGRLEGWTDMRDVPPPIEGPSP